MSDIEMIEADDMGYHRHVIQQTAEASQLQQQFRQIQQRLQDIQGGQVSWASYLQQKYGLGEGDFVDGAGVIKRRVPQTGQVLKAVAP